MGIPANACEQAKKSAQTAEPENIFIRRAMIWGVDWIAICSGAL